MENIFLRVSLFLLNIQDYKKILQNCEKNKTKKDMYMNLFKTSFSSKKSILLITLSLTLSTNLLSAQSEVDVVVPESSSFNLGSSIEGLAANSVNEVTGKVVFSVPLTNISSRSVSYPVNLTYNGAVAFDQGQQLHKYSPVSSVGVGFDLSVPKIVVDHKGTAVRDDDTFYLLDGTNNTKLVCTKKNIIGGPPSTGESYLEFQMEKYQPYKLKYHISFTDFDIVNGVGSYTTYTRDYWTLTDDKGITYTYGNTNNTRENIIAWGNWIGDSKRASGASEHTVVWNLAKIQDQWGNNLTFTYEEVSQKTNSSNSVTHDEASYIKEIISSSTGKIVFEYEDKTAQYYYEPHMEQSEPDAYQERYEKKRLKSVKTYDNANQLVSSQNLVYTYEYAAQGERKMYLDRITLKDSNGEAPPSQYFDYYTSGTFEGGIKKITYPSGGSVTYNYQNKLLFTNSPNRFSGTVPSISGFDFRGSYVKDNYVINLFRSQNTVSGNKYQFKMIRHWWNGENWLSDEFVFPHLLSDENLVGKVMDRFLSVFEDDFYAFLYFDRNSDKGSLYLFHQENDGKSWKDTQYLNFSLQSNNNDNNDFPYKDPTLLSGNGFVAVGENESTYGRLRTYVWNDTSWNTKIINQGVGTYYYGATNNFIISLDENGNGTDLITGATHPDYYYFHYLDAEKIWQTKSWSSTIDNSFTYVSGTNDPSYFYPSNNMVGFMADNNNEFFLRWNTNYDLIAVDNYLGTYTDTSQMFPSMGSMMTVQDSWNRHVTDIAARFNGNGWDLIEFGPQNLIDEGPSIFGDDLIMIYDLNTDKVSHSFYNPNTEGWYSNTFSHTTPFTAYYHLATSYNQDFFVAGNKIGKFNNTASRHDPLISLGLPGDLYMTYSNTLNYSFVVIRNGSSYNALLYRVDKKTGDLKNINLGNKIHVTGSPKFGGYNQFLSQKSMFLRPNTFSSPFSSTYLYRILDDEVDNSVYDIVLSSVFVNNGEGEIRILDYDYNDANSIPDGESTFYGEVIVQNLGTGKGNIGKTKKYFKTGEDDIQLAGLPTKVIVEDKSGIRVSETETIWKKFSKNYINSSFKTVGSGYYIRPEKTIEKLVYGSDEVVTETNNSYNSIGLMTSSSRVNSNGVNEVTSTQYAYQNYTFVNDRNMLSFPYQTTITIGGTTTAVEQSIWKLGEGKAYVYQNKSGTSTGNLRLNSEITKVDSYGNIQESNNGQGIYKTTLYGYGNLYPVATIANAEYNDVVNALNVTYTQLQNLTSTLESELDDLYSALPDAMVNINIYDNHGRITKALDERDEALSFAYDTFGRLEYTTDANNKVIEKKEYNFAGN